MDNESTGDQPTTSSPTKTVRHFAIGETETDISHIEYIGAGGFGEVHKLINSTTGTAFARKLTRQVGTKDDFDNEVRAIKKLCQSQHPNIVQVLSYGRLSSEGIWSFIDMELCHISLQNYLYHHSETNGLRSWSLIPENQIATHAYKILQQILNGLAYIHGMGEVHRDLSPHNVLFRDRYWKIADFGLTSAGTSKRLLDTTSRGGKQGYRAPELLKDSGGSYNNKSDIWAFGCLVCELFSGVKAFANDLQTHYHADQNRAWVPRNPLQERDNLTVHYCSGLFEVNPEDRPSARALLGDKFSTELPSFDSVPPQKRRRISLTAPIALSSPGPSSLLRDTFNWAVSRREIDTILALVEAGVKPVSTLAVYHMLDAFYTTDWNQSVYDKFQRLINLCPASYWLQHVPGFKSKEKSEGAVSDKFIRKVRFLVFGEDETTAHRTSWSISQNEWLHGDDWYAITVPELFKVSLFHTERLVNETKIDSFQFSQDGRYFATHGDVGVRVYELHVDSHAAVLSLDTISEYIGSDIVSCLHFTNNSSRLVAAYQTGLIGLWDLATKEKALLLESRTPSIVAMDVSQDDTRLVGVSEEKFTLWSLETGKVIADYRFSGKILGSVAFSWDGQFAIAGARLSGRGYVAYFDQESKEIAPFSGYRYEMWGHEDSIISVACSHSEDGKFISGSLDNTVKLWKIPLYESRNRQNFGLKIFESEATLRGTDKHISTVVFSPDDRWVLSGSTTGSIRVWDAVDGTFVLLLNGHDGSEGTLEERVSVNATVISIAFPPSPNGVLLAVAFNDGMLQLWNYSWLEGVLERYPEEV